ncbi:alpha/beta hydrolase family protein [Paenibacillus alba]|uniref:Prolyl oligopeptidase family serine peptidase n=1 Tax=Paenibacillus alba TaxID=1197127 RepID=A0ABU6GB82_9BACL|nr:alpha/beta fold hydrolase [Paenibacillus alba]MEC0231401.1 prolyl oligopeptidase family serine peptidase [Paenibacillus alba]
MGTKDDVNLPNQSVPWDLEALYQAGPVYSAPEFEEGEIKAIFYEGLPYQANSTRVFAYYGIPESSSEAKVPGIVLVHGGGGTAFKEWVRIWVDKGYAAIAMDLEGHIGTVKNCDGMWPGHEWSGPARQGEFKDYELPVEDQWMYHAAADVIQAHSILRAFDQVDTERIGVHGISWGGIVTSLVAGVDDRFSFAIPVYGCGYLYEAGNQYGKSFADMPPEDRQRTKQLWDPSSYFHRISMPMLWVNGSHDPHFPLQLFSKSYVASQQGVAPTNLSMQFGLRHSHSAGWQPQEIYQFADHITKAGPSLPQLSLPERSGMNVKVVISSDAPIVKAVCCYAADIADWFNVEWSFKDAQLELAANEIHATLADTAAAYFIQVTDERGNVVSTPIQMLTYI